MRRRRLGILDAVAVFGLATAASAAQLNVGAGSSLDLGTGSLNLGCADLVVAGTLAAGTEGLDQARNVTITSGGELDGESATINVAGDWDNSGTFARGTSTVDFVDGCSISSAMIRGDTTFYTLAMTTSSGKFFNFEDGTTQTIEQSLVLAGASGNRLQIRSTVDGNEAYLDLQGTQSISYVDVKDNHATGNQIEYGPDSSSLGNTEGWVFLGIPVPALGPVALALLAALLMTASAFAIRSRVFAG